MSRRNRRPVAPQRDVPSSITSPLLGLSDLRLWSPGPPVLRPVFTPRDRVLPAQAAVTFRKPRIVARSASLPSLGLPHRIAFERPRELGVCVRRQQRKQVLFAKRLTGKGARSPRKRNAYSSIGC